jgi:hypothetical protein
MKCQVYYLVESTSSRDSVLATLSDFVHLSPVAAVQIANQRQSSIAALILYRRSEIGRCILQISFYLLNDSLKFKFHRRWSDPRDTDWTCESKPTR